MDIEELREPLEVYAAAAGDGELLAKRIESGCKMTAWERRALTAFLRGELAPPKRKPGQRTLPHLPSDTVEGLNRLRIENAVILLRFQMSRRRENGEAYGNFRRVLEQVADHDGLSAEETESVLNSYKRSNSRKLKSNPVKPLVQMYHRWLLRTGRLPDFPQPVGIPPRF